MSSITRKIARANGTWRRRRGAAQAQGSTLPKSPDEAFVRAQLRRLLTRAQRGATMRRIPGNSQRNGPGDDEAPP